MKSTMIDTRAVILALKKVKKERGLSIEKIYKMVEENDPAHTVSHTSVARVFRQGSEEQIFKWENTLKPIANALLDIEEIEIDDDINTQAYKSILKLKKDIIIELENKLSRAESAASDTDYFTRTIAHLEKQIELKDKRIDQLLDANDEMRKDLTKLTDRILKCQRCDK